MRRDRSLAEQDIDFAWSRKEGRMKTLDSSQDRKDRQTLDYVYV